MRPVLILICAASLVACDVKPEKPKVHEQSSNVAPVVPVATIEDKLAAMLRGHPNSKRICVDADRDNAFFLDYGPLPKEAAERVLFNGGWIFIEKVDFYKTSNNTWFIINQDEKKYIAAYPDITGLTCKTHNG